MTAQEAAVAGIFAAARPQAVDFPQGDYEAAREAFVRIAAEHGYRLAGIRLGRAVFTSKPPAPVARIPSNEDVI